MACGTGKTLVGAEVSRLVAASGKVLVVVPTLDLLAQTARVYAAWLGENAGVIGAACSDHSAQAEAARLRPALAHLNGGVSTDPGGIAAWLRSGRRVTVFTTYSSLPAVAAAHTAPGVPGWDLAVIDEAHRAAGRTDRAWNVINYDTAIPAARRLYMTATPRIMSSERYETVSMDKEAVFGPEVFRLAFADAIEAGLLADYRVAVVVVTDAEVARLTAPAANRIVSADGPPVTAGMLAAQIAALKASAQWNLRRVITYHSRVATAHRFAETLLNAAGLLPAGERPAIVAAQAVDGQMPPWQRRDILRHLDHPRDRTVVVSNCQVLAEGVDIPELDAVLFADPRDSATDVVQAVGRALRRGTAEGKIATVIVPVLLNAAENPEAALEGSQFDTVWRVVRALRSHDERLSDWLDEGRVRVTAWGAREGKGGILDAPQWLSLAGQPVTAAFARALELRLLNATTSRWLDGYARAVAWRAGHGHLRVPVDQPEPDGYLLGRWIAGQRTARKRGELPPDRVAKLDELGMVWDMGAVHAEAAWQAGIRAAAAYRAEHGHLDVPQRYAADDGFRLGTWIDSRRDDYRAGKLASGRAAALEALGMRWDLGDAWERNLAAAREYHAVHGHINVPSGHPPVSGVKLGTWIVMLRGQYRKGELAAERAAVLERLRIDWSPRWTWDDNLEALREFIAEHGHCVLPRDYRTPRGIRLSPWLTGARKQWRSGMLAPARTAALEELGVPLDPGEPSWLDGLEDCRDFRREHGHLRIPHPAAGKRIKALGSWLSNRRKDYAAGRLAPDRAAALEELGIEWGSPRDRDQSEMIAALRAYRAENGNADVPYRYVTADGLRLGQWLRNKKAQLARGDTVLPATREALEELRVRWHPPRRRNQPGMIAALRAWHAENGHAMVPGTYVTPDGLKLGQWLANKKAVVRRGGKIHPEAQEVLTELGVTWVPGDMPRQPDNRSSLQ